MVRSENVFKILQIGSWSTGLRLISGAGLQAKRDYTSLSTSGGSHDGSSSRHSSGSACTDTAHESKENSFKLGASDETTGVDDHLSNSGSTCCSSA